MRGITRSDTPSISSGASAVPAVGDSIACQARPGNQGGILKLRGRVRSRHFDLQTQEDGAPCVWVRIIVDVADATRHDARHWVRANPRSFSEN